MSFTLVLNSQNTFGTGNNTYKYNFIQGNFVIPPDSEVMVANVQIPYSFYNITAAYNNNQFQFSFPTGSSGYTTSTITIPDGFYTTTSLNYYLQQWMISNGYYLINGSGQNIYYYSIQYNSYQYGNQLLSYLVPTSLPNGYTAPANWAGYPSVSRCPYITILNNNFGTFLGFTAGGYPFGNNASITPVLTPTTIASITVTTAGTGYTGYVALTFTGGGGTASGYTANVVGGVIKSINNGTSSGYTTAPTVGITLVGSGSGANITCSIAGGVITGFTIISGGSAYGSQQTVIITSTNGAGTTSTNWIATLSSVGGITTIAGGTSTGYTAVPNVSILSSTGSGFVGLAVLTATSIASLTINNGGSGYLGTIVPTLNFSGGGGSGASATAVVTNGVITSTTSLVGGSGYTGVPSVSIVYAGDNLPYSANSSITPVGSTVNSIIVRCSLVDNKVSVPMDILDSFTIGGTSFGANINYAPAVPKWVKLASGSFSNFYITFCDQNLNLLAALDNNIMITLLVRLGQAKLLRND